MMIVIISHLYVRIDVFMIDMFHGKAQVAQYTAAYNLLDYMMILSNMIMTAVFPNFTALAAKDLGKFKVLYRRVIEIFAIYLFPLAVLVMIFSSSILRVVYGSSYSLASTALIILMIAAVFAWLNGPSGTIFIAHKKQNIYAWGCLVSLIVNVIGNFF